jgi:hypothetical protein
MPCLAGKALATGQPFLLRSGGSGAPRQLPARRNCRETPLVSRNRAQGREGSGIGNVGVGIAAVASPGPRAHVNSTQLIAPLCSLTSLRNNLIASCRTVFSGVDGHVLIIVVCCRLGSWLKGVAAPAHAHAHSRRHGRRIQGHFGKFSRTVPSARAHRESKEGLQNPKSTPTRVQAGSQADGARRGHAKRRPRLSGQKTAETRGLLPFRFALTPLQ